jgi:hypothetical protein
MKPLTHAHGSDRQRVEALLTARIARWQRVIDEIKLQIHLGVREVRDRVVPLLTKMEAAVSHANTELRQLNDCDECDRDRVQQSLEQTLRGLEKQMAEVRRSREPRED